jgi:hypothetical protein
VAGVDDLFGDCVENDKFFAALSVDKTLTLIEMCSNPIDATGLWKFSMH